MKRLIMLAAIIITVFFICLNDNNQVLFVAAQENSIEEDLLQLPTFSHQGGFYETQFYLEISTDDSGIIYYTLDGSDPTIDSMRYNNPILIQKQYIQITGQGYSMQNDGTGQVIDLDPTVPLSMIKSSSFEWKSPSDDIFKATVVKAIVISDDQTSLVATQTYFVDENIYDKYTFPIISLSTDAKNLFSYETGINVPGINYDPFSTETRFNNKTGNYYQEGDLWERDVYFEYFSSDGQLNFKQNAGIRIHGGLSRNYPIKSYRLYARDDYGQDMFNYRFFEDKELNTFKRIILRAGGQTYKYTFMGEAAAQSLLKPLDLDIQYSQPVILFINGEYFGIRNIRDRFDDWYISTTYDINKDDITILTGNAYYQDGNPSGASNYQFLYEFVTRMNMAKDINYKFVDSQMDIKNFVDYYIAELYYANQDWPQNNILYWRNNVRYHPNAEIGKDGKWRWMVYDVDGGFAASWGGNTPDANPFTKLTGETWKTGKMFTSLLENEMFRTYFINRYADLMNTIFKPDRVLDIINEMEALYAPEMEEHIARWGYPLSVSTWENYIDVMKDFANERPIYALNQLKDYLNLDETTKLEIKGNLLMGNVKVNSLLLNGELASLDENNKWEGTYYKNQAISLVAIPNEGYKFKGWYDQYDTLVSLNSSLEINLDSNESYEARYEVGASQIIEDNLFWELNGPWFIVLFGMGMFTLSIYIAKNKEKFKKTSKMN